MYRVFVSHGWHDRWLAKQLARCIREDAGADPFINIFDIKRGDRIEDRIADELPTCDELMALLLLGRSAGTGSGTKSVRPGSFASGW